MMLTVQHLCNIWQSNRSFS